MMNDILNLLISAIWDLSVPEKEISDDMYQELRYHAIATLFASKLNEYKMSESLRSKWRNHILQAIAYYTNYMHVQNALEITVPYVILKGTSAAQYYKYPMLRSMGDIDIITNHNDYKSACEMLLCSDYKEILNHPETEYERHRLFSKNGIIVEIHSYFSMLNDPKKAEFFDNQIICNINSTHVLPDEINGLVLLEHINQHMEEGLGLRQIIDWMMFVDKCLPDDSCSSFLELTEKTGLYNLAIITTRMCELFLGLSHRKWCENADDNLCKELLDYIFSCGNFGKKKTSESDIGQKIFARARSPRAIIKLLQERGLINWKLLHKYQLLRPFAWLYQIYRYLRKGFGRDKAVIKLKSEYEAAKRRNALFDELGIRQASKGIVVYKDGKYVKK